MKPFLYRHYVKFHSSLIRTIVNLFVHHCVISTKFYSTCSSTIFFFMLLVWLVVPSVPRGSRSALPSAVLCPFDCIHCDVRAAVLSVRGILPPAICTPSGTSVENSPGYTVCPTSEILTLQPSCIHHILFSPDYCNCAFRLVGNDRMTYGI
jgi:hypothetical protein